MGCLALPTQHQCVGHRYRLCGSQNILHELSCVAHTAYVCWTQILQETESVGHMAPSSSSAPGPRHKRTEAKLVLQLATWMANTGQGAKSDITGLPTCFQLELSYS